MNHIRFTLIGAGEITRIMLPHFLNRGDVAIESVVDPNADLAGDIAEKCGGVRVYSDYREALAGPGVDAVYIATPPFLHREMVVGAIGRGKHVLCEKPFLMNLEEMDAVEAAHAKSPGLNVACCSSRFHATPAVRAAREFIADGKLGRLLRVRMVTGLRLPKPAATLPGWKRSRATSGGGVAMDWGAYDLDWLAHMLGDAFQPVSIFGSVDFWRDEEIECESSFSAEIRCANGLPVAWERRCEHGPAVQRVEIRGTEGGLDLPFSPDGQPEALTLHRFGPDNTLESTVLSEPVRDWGAILGHPLNDFLTAVQTGGPVASDTARQRMIRRVLDGLYESAKTGDSVMLV